MGVNLHIPPKDPSWAGEEWGTTERVTTPTVGAARAGPVGEEVLQEVVVPLVEAARPVEPDAPTVVDGRTEVTGRLVDPGGGVTVEVHPKEVRRRERPLRTGVHDGT